MPQTPSAYASSAYDKSGSAANEKSVAFVRVRRQIFRTYRSSSLKPLILGPSRRSRITDSNLQRVSSPPGYGFRRQSTARFSIAVRVLQGWIAKRRPLASSGAFPPLRDWDHCHDNRRSKRLKFRPVGPRPGAKRKPSPRETSTRFPGQTNEGKQRCPPMITDCCRGLACIAAAITTFFNHRL